MKYTQPERPIKVKGLHRKKIMRSILITFKRAMRKTTHQALKIMIVQEALKTSFLQKTIIRLPLKTLLIQE
jgi:hypothetical protein